jgi:hypothetical protein
VEQQGKTVEELNETMKESFWIKQREQVQETDKLLLEHRAKHAAE